MPDADRTSKVTAIKPSQKNTADPSSGPTVLF